MRILVVGASGTIGRAVAAELAGRHEVVSAGRRSGDVRLDITDEASVRAAFEALGSVDAVVCAAGHVTFAPLEEMDAGAYAVGLADKLMGQVGLVLAGRPFVSDGGSFTLTTGVLDRQPIPTGSSASMVNGALNAFVMAAATELPRGLRLNAVSPGVIAEDWERLAPMFPGFEPVPAAVVARAYAGSVEGQQTGRVFRVG
jgi:NAD(P)-dependent dehydrogenase (short-subunit alcohol dehydrogenase family)